MSDVPPVPNKVLIENWNTELTRLWSMRVTLFWTMFWSGLGGLFLVWPVFMGQIPEGLYIGLGILMPVSIGVARLLKQRGAD